MPTWLIIACILVSFVSGWVGGALYEQRWWRRLIEKDSARLFRSLR
jgi:hypothetical protein